VLFKVGRVRCLGSGPINIFVVLVRGKNTATLVVVVVSVHREPVFVGRVDREFDFLLRPDHARQSSVQIIQICLGTAASSVVGSSFGAHFVRFGRRSMEEGRRKPYNGLVFVFWLVLVFIMVGGAVDGR